MSVEKPTPWILIITSSMLLTWIRGVLFSAAIVIGVIYVWLTKEIAFSRENIIVFLPFLFMFGWTLSTFRFPTITTTFDKSINNFILEKQWIWTRRTRQYLFREIKDIHVIRKGWFGKARRYYKIKIELSSGELIPISALNYGNEESLRRKAKELETFLDAETSPGV